VGYFFFETGLGKVQDLDAMTERFIEWGIPAPAFNAALSGYTELIGGALVVLGLMTRFASIPMVINMVVAVITVNLKGVSGLDEFVELDEPLYALAFLWLVFAGPGKASLDRPLFHFWKKRRSSLIPSVT
jgi:putative oxidoreductase